MSNIYTTKDDLTRILGGDHDADDMSVLAVLSGSSGDIVMPTPVGDPEVKGSLPLSALPEQWRLSDQYWETQLPSGTTLLSYSFPTSLPASWAAVNPVFPLTFEAFGPEAQELAALALKQWSDVADIVFLPFGDDLGIIRFFSVSLASPSFVEVNGAPEINPDPGGSLARAVAPDNDLSNDRAGDIRFNLFRPETQELLDGLSVIGDQAYETLMHEIGHTLNFNHPGDYDASDADSPSYNSSAEYAEDTHQYTVMSYWSEKRSGADFRGAKQDTLMLHDMYVVQQIYGVNTNTRTGDTTYGYGSSLPGDPIYDFDVNVRPVMTIWDAGGNDTLNLDSPTAFDRPVDADLRPGTFTSFNLMTNNISMAFTPPGVENFIENLITGSGNDTLSGNLRDNHLIANAGQDLAVGWQGDDTIEGGDGFDTLRGESGNDSLLGGDDNDTIEGGDGADRLFGGDQNDRLSGGNGRDFLDGGEGIDNLTGNDGRDTLLGGLGDDSMFGDDGNDSLNGGSGSDAMSGGFGNDTLVGGRDGDLIAGNAGNDLIDGGLGNDAMIGGSGIDTADYSRFVNPWKVDLFRGDADTGGADALYGVPGPGGTIIIPSAPEDDDLFGFENALTGAGADTVIGTDGNNVLRSGAGNDLLLGGDGTNIIDGGAGFDIASHGTLDPGGVIGGPVEGVTVSLSLFGPQEVRSGPLTTNTYFSIEGLVGTIYADTLTGDAKANWLEGRSGADALNGLEGMDSLVGGLGADSLLGGGGNDMLRGGPGGDVLSGGAGNDTASYSDATAGVTVNMADAALNTGDAAGDQFFFVENLEGSAFADALTGNGGDNRIEGGAGNDTVAGGSGLDTFVFGAMDGSNLILDFDTGLDLISIAAPGLGFADLLITEDLNVGGGIAKQIEKGGPALERLEQVAEKTGKVFTKDVTVSFAETDINMTISVFDTLVASDFEFA